MDTKTSIVRAAEQLFDRHGFTASGVDRLTRAANVSSRTLYKHVGSKIGLVTAVLDERDRRFRGMVDVGTVGALFDALEDWVRIEGARGCLFLRALGETGGSEPDVAAAVEAQKAALSARIRTIVSLELGADDERLAEQILVLFEGATATAVYRGPGAIASAREAALVLLATRSRA